MINFFFEIFYCLSHSVLAILTLAVIYIFSVVNSDKWPFIKKVNVGACNICFLTTTNCIEVQKYLFGTNGLISVRSEQWAKLSIDLFVFKSQGTDG